MVFTVPSSRSGRADDGGAGVARRARTGRLVSLLERHGNPLMAKVVVTNAAKALKIDVDAATPEQFERLVEELMKSYRLFCRNDEARRALWIELTALIDE